MAVGAARARSPGDAARWGERGLSAFSCRAVPDGETLSIPSALGILVASHPAEPRVPPSLA